MLNTQNKFNIVCIGAGEMFRYCVRAILMDSESRVSAIFTWSENVAQRASRVVSLDGFSQDVDIPLIKVETMNTHERIGELKELQPDLVFVDGWSEKLSPSLLEVAPDKFVCLHPSLLPKSRGGATLNWALIHGEKDWGLTLFYMTNKIDHGDIIAQERFALEQRDTIHTAFDKAAVAAMDLLRKTIPLLRTGRAERRPQSDPDATFFPRRKPEQGEIDWTHSNEEVYHLIRALTHPYPGAFFCFREKKVTVWQALSPDEKLKTLGSTLLPGQIQKILMGKGVVVACGMGSIELERVQLQGEPAMWADEWCRRHNGREGTVLPGKVSVVNMGQ